jgi:hypothetical protein
VRTHLNTLFVTLEGAYLRKDGAAVEVRHRPQHGRRQDCQLPLRAAPGRA